LSLRGFSENSAETPLAPTRRSSTETFVRKPEEIGERLFDFSVSLKVLASQYAMHLDPERRRALFRTLDSLLSVEAWHEEDDFPSKSSFRDFLKWEIYSNDLPWTSLGLSDEGNLLLAWRTGAVFLTATFKGNGTVTWTAEVQSNSKTSYAAGQGAPLQHFTHRLQIFI
jgi:hypothetical protein